MDISIIFSLLLIMLCDVTYFCVHLGKYICNINL